MGADSGEDKTNPVTVLIGGWAIYCYNQYYGSVDLLIHLGDLPL